MSLFYEDTIVQYGDLAAAGTSEVKSSVVDMGAVDGAEELTYVVTFGDNVNGSVVTITAKENTANSTTSPTPTNVTLTLVSSGASLGTAAAVTNGSLVVTCATSDTDEKNVVISVKKAAMTKQYQFLSVTPATQNAVIASINCFVRGNRRLPVTQDSSCIAIARAAS